MISLYGSSGFVGSNYKAMYEDTLCVARDDRKPLSDDILYMISTTDNYNVHDQITLDVDTNLHVLCEVLDHCRSENITFNFVSSWFVYGQGKHNPRLETSVCNPTGFYSITKLCAENLIKSFAETYGIDYRILRLCNVLGAGDKNASRKKNAITWMINQLKEDKEISLYDRGTHTRDVMHVKDVCRAIRLVLNKGQVNRVYNIGSGQPTAISAIISLAKYHLNSKSDIKSITPPDFHKAVQCKDFWMDTSGLDYLGFKPEHDLESIVKELCR